MQHAPDADQVGTGKPEMQKMPGAADDAAFVPRAVTAMAEMIAVHIVAEFGAADASGPVGLGGQIAQCCHQQIFVSQPRLLPEAFMRLRHTKKRPCRYF